MDVNNKSFNEILATVKLVMESILVRICDSDDENHSQGTNLIVMDVMGGLLKQIDENDKTISSPLSLKDMFDNYDRIDDVLTQDDTDIFTDDCSLRVVEEIPGTLLTAPLFSFYGNSNRMYNDSKFAKHFDDWCSVVEVMNDVLSQVEIMLSTCLHECFAENITHNSSLHSVHMFKVHSSQPPQQQNSRYKHPISSTFPTTTCLAPFNFAEKNFPCSKSFSTEFNLNSSEFSQLDSTFDQGSSIDETISLLDSLSQISLFSCKVSGITSTQGSFVASQSDLSENEYFDSELPKNCGITSDGTIIDDKIPETSKNFDNLFREHSESCNKFYNNIAQKKSNHCLSLDKANEEICDTNIAFRVYERKITQCSEFIKHECSAKESSIEDFEKDFNKLGNDNEQEDANQLMINESTNISDFISNVNTLSQSDECLMQELTVFSEPKYISQQDNCQIIINESLDVLEDSCNNILDKQKQILVSKHGEIYNEDQNCKYASNEQDSASNDVCGIELSRKSCNVSTESIELLQSTSDDAIEANEIVKKTMNRHGCCIDESDEIADILKELCDYAAITNCNSITNTKHFERTDASNCSQMCHHLVDIDNSENIGESFNNSGQCKCNNEILSESAMLISNELASVENSLVSKNKCVECTEMSKNTGLAKNYKNKCINDELSNDICNGLSSQEHALMVNIEENEVSEIIMNDDPCFRGQSSIIMKEDGEILAHQFGEKSRDKVNLIIKDKGTALLDDVCSFCTPADTRQATNERSVDMLEDNHFNTMEYNGDIVADRNELPKDINSTSWLSCCTVDKQKKTFEGVCNNILSGKCDNSLFQQDGVVLGNIHACDVSMKNATLLSVGIAASYEDHYDPSVTENNNIADNDISKVTKSICNIPQEIGNIVIGQQLINNCFKQDNVATEKLLSTSVDFSVDLLNQSGNANCDTKEYTNKKDFISTLQSNKYAVKNTSSMCSDHTSFSSLEGCKDAANKENQMNELYTKDEMKDDKQSIFLCNTSQKLEKFSSFVKNESDSSFLCDDNLLNDYKSVSNCGLASGLSIATPTLHTSSSHQSWLKFVNEGTTTSFPTSNICNVSPLIEEDELNCQSSCYTDELLNGRLEDAVVPGESEAKLSNNVNSHHEVPSGRNNSSSSLLVTDKNNASTVEVVALQDCPSEQMPKNKDDYLLTESGITQTSDKDTIATPDELTVLLHTKSPVPPVVVNTASGQLIKSCSPQIKKENTSKMLSWNPWQWNNHKENFNKEDRDLSRNLLGGNKSDNVSVSISNSTQMPDTTAADRNNKSDKIPDLQITHVLARECPSQSTCISKENVECVNITGLEKKIVESSNEKPSDNSDQIVNSDDINFNEVNISNEIMKTQSNLSNEQFSSHHNEAGNNKDDSTKMKRDFHNEFCVTNNANYKRASTISGIIAAERSNLNTNCSSDAHVHNSQTRECSNFLETFKELHHTSIDNQSMSACNKANQDMNSYTTSQVQHSINASSHTSSFYLDDQKVPSPEDATSHLYQEHDTNMYHDSLKDEISKEETDEEDCLMEEDDGLQNYDASFKAGKLVSSWKDGQYAASTYRLDRLYPVVPLKTCNRPRRVGLSRPGKVTKRRFKPYNM